MYDVQLPLQYHRWLPWPALIINTRDMGMRGKRDCALNLFHRYRFPPYAATNATQEERDFPLAYTILANRYVNQILLLLSAVYREHNFHCVHFDAKSSRPSFLALKLAVGCLPNVFMSSARVVVTYAHVSRLEADIICMKDMLRLKEYTVKWKYLINMCSQVCVRLYFRDPECVSSEGLLLFRSSQVDFCTCNCTTRWLCRQGFFRFCLTDF